MTLSLVAAVYAVVGTNTVGWTSAPTIGLFAAAAALMGLFVAVEARVRAPLVPLGIFRARNLAASNVVMVLILAGMFGWFFFLALYLQRVLGYGPLQTGLAFLPGPLIFAALNYSAAAKAVGRFGVKPMLVGGMSLMALSLALLARAPVGGSFLVDVLPSVVLLGLGVLFAFLAAMVASVSGVPDRQLGGRGRSGRVPQRRIPRQDRRVLLDALEELGEHADQAGTLVLLEPLNRYEDHMLNRVGQAVELCEAIGRGSVKVMGDLFHMNIEEDDPAGSIRAASGYLAHVHLADSNRAQPGTGHTDFASAFGALHDIGFDGYMALECGVRGDARTVLPQVTRHLRSSTEP